MSPPHERALRFGLFVVVALPSLPIVLLLASLIYPHAGRLGVLAFVGVSGYLNWILADRLR